MRDVKQWKSDDEGEMQSRVRRRGRNQGKTEMVERCKVEQDDDSRPRERYREQDDEI